MSDPIARLRVLEQEMRTIASRPNRPTGFLLCADALAAELTELESEMSNPVGSPLRGEPERAHRCSGCGLRWGIEDAQRQFKTETGAELCGDCWRQAQPVLHRAAVAEGGAPTLEGLAQYLGWGTMSAEQAFAFMCKREGLLRYVQAELETEKSNGATAREFLEERIAALRAVVAKGGAHPPTEQATVARLRTLACRGAFEAHMAQFEYGDDDEGHTHPFDTCPHPDCVLVRVPADRAAAPEKPHK